MKKNKKISTNQTRKNKIDLWLSEDEKTKISYHMEKKLYKKPQDFFRACLDNPINPEIHNYKIHLLKELNRIGVNFNQAILALNKLAKDKNTDRTKLIEISTRLVEIEKSFKGFRK